MARILSGKDSPKYTPFIDTGDHVIVINADKVRITGLKADSKVYHHYSGYPGGMKSEEYKKRMVRKPEQVVEEAITGMLPHTKLGRAMAGKLKVYRGDKHPALGAEAGSDRRSRKARVAQTHWKDKGSRLPRINDGRTWFSITERVAANRAWPAYSFAPVAASSRSTARPSTALRDRGAAHHGEVVLRADRDLCHLQHDVHSEPAAA